MTRRRLAATGVLAVLLVAGATTAVHGQRMPNAYALRGAFVYNVLNFVQWPPSSLTADGTLRVAVIATEPVAEFALALSGRTVQGRTILVKVYQDASQLGLCHVVFITSDAAAEARTVMRMVDQKAVLTITEQSLDSRGPAIISLGVADTKLGFNVNLDAADAAGIQLSANLLKLARHVQSQRLEALK